MMTVNTKQDPWLGLETSDPKACAALARQLRDAGRWNEAVAKRLMNARDPKKRKTVVWIAGGCPWRQVSSLLKYAALKEKTREVRMTAVLALSSVRDKGAQQLLSHLAADPNPEVSKAAVLGLWSQGARAELRSIVEKLNGAPVVAALEALGAGHEVSKEDLECARKRAQDSSPEVREAAEALLARAPS